MSKMKLSITICDTNVKLSSVHSANVWTLIIRQSTEEVIRRPLSIKEQHEDEPMELGNESQGASANSEDPSSADGAFNGGDRMELGEESQGASANSEDRSSADGAENQGAMANSSPGIHPLADQINPVMDVSSIPDDPYEREARKRQKDEKRTQRMPMEHATEHEDELFNFGEEYKNQFNRLRLMGKGGYPGLMPNVPLSPFYKIDYQLPTDLAIESQLFNRPGDENQGAMTNSSPGICPLSDQINPVLEVSSIPDDPYEREARERQKDEERIQRMATVYGDKLYFRGKYKNKFSRKLKRKGGFYPYLNLTKIRKLKSTHKFNQQPLNSLNHISSCQNQIMSLINQRVKIQ